MFDSARKDRGGFAGVSGEAVGLPCVRRRVVVGNHGKKKKWKKKSENLKNLTELRVEANQWI